MSSSTDKNKPLEIKSQITNTGITITVRGKKFSITYPAQIWKKTPAEIKNIMLENLTFGDTHFLPVMLGYTAANYDTNFPLFESILFRNQMMGMLKCEVFDRKPILTYLRQFYNLKFTFANEASTLPFSSKRRTFKKSPPTAVIPFTFGKESLLTCAICLELGIKPVLVYSQEPTQPHEEKYKKKKLLEFSKRYGAEVYFVENGPGLFRYGKAFEENKGTEIGWSSQTTLITLQVLPFVFAYQAQYILLGNEYSNNEYTDREGWQMSLSPDQNSFFTKQQDSMISLITEGNCRVRSSLEPLEEANIFFTLHTRYPEIGKYQFSCSAEEPLYKDSQWCHKCYKCVRMFLFARVGDIDPFSIGYKEDLLNTPGLLENYFGEDTKSGSAHELDFCFYTLYKKGIKSPYVERFKKEKLPYITDSWEIFREYFTQLHPALNLPEKYKDKLNKIFKEGITDFKKVLPR